MHKKTNKMKEFHGKHSGLALNYFKNLKYIEILGRYLYKPNCDLKNK